MCLLLACYFVARIAYRWWQSRDITYQDISRNSRVFVSKQYRVRAKPDRLKKDINNRTVIYEHKSRKAKGVRESDRAQMEASVLTLRERGYVVEEGVLVNGLGNEYKVKFPDTATMLSRQLGEHIKNARLVMSGAEPAPCNDGRKCKGCAYKDVCTHALH